MLIELTQEQLENLMVIINNAKITGKDAEYISNLKKSLNAEVKQNKEKKKAE